VDNEDRLVRTEGTRTSGDARRMEHTAISESGTLLQDREGVNEGNYRGNQQAGISERNLKKYYPDC
jgi:hypothetical protein